ncbi:MAG TPA: hypothetical protein VGR35_13310 [Tepidisphaeraceae bacterium]|nr:hypothetical protein [Tepidisphaeraceae bacterium]
MRLYCKLALMVLVVWAGQAVLSSSVAGEAYFTLRCFAALKAGDVAAEAELVEEWQRKLRAEGEKPVTVIAFRSAGPALKLGRVQ